MGDAVTPNCGSNCFYCTRILNTNNFYCNECIYYKSRYASFSPDNNFANAAINKLNGLNRLSLNCDTTTSRLSTTLTLGNLFVSPLIPTCVSDSSCDGSYSKPFGSLNSLLEYVKIKA